MLSLPFRPFFALVAGLALTGTLVGQAELPHTGKILPTDLDDYDAFGIAVAANEDWIVSSTQFHDGTGKVYAYKRGVVLQEFEIDPIDPAAALFGSSLALDGNTLLVGDLAFDGSRGRVDVFEYDGVSFLHVGALVGSNHGDLFGTSLGLDLSSGWAAIGAPGEAGQGRVYVYDIGATKWRHEITLQPFAGSSFGQSLDLEGDLLAIADPEVDASRGNVRVYEWNGTQFLLRDTVTHPATVAGDQFGYSIDIDADHLLVGAVHSTGVAANSGAAFLFRRSGNDWIDPWTLLDPDGATGDRLGQSVHLRGSVASASAPYHDHVYDEAGSVLQWRNRNGTWILAQRQIDVFYQHGVRLGLAHALLDGETVVGAPGRNDGGTVTGVLYTYDVPDFALSFDTEIVSPGATVHVNHSGGEPGRPVWFYLLSFDGSPMPIKILNGVFDANGEWNLQGNAPPGGLGGALLEFGSFSFTSDGKIEASNRFLVTMN